MLLHKLALRFGRTVAETQASLSVAEWTYWLAFARSYPIGIEEMHDVLTARLCSVVVNANGVKKQGGGKFTPDDFVTFRVKDFRNPLHVLGGLPGLKVVRYPGTRRKRNRNKG